MGANPPLEPFALPLPSHRQLDVTGKLGFADVFPQRPGQEEDVLTESNMRQGFMPNNPLQNETLSAFDIYRDKIMSDQGVTLKLQKLAAEVSRVKQQYQKIPPATSFQAPVRQACNFNWMSQFSQPNVPMRTLAEVVPTEPRTKAELLQEIINKRLPLTRASWLIKVCLLHEGRQRSWTQDRDMILEWTKEVTKFMQGQWDLLRVQPTKTNSRKKNLVSDAGKWLRPEDRAAFCAKWKYCLRLVTWQYDEGLMDQRETLKWILDRFKESNFDQTSAVIPLIAHFIPQYARSRQLARFLIDLYLAKLTRLNLLRENKLVFNQYLSLISLAQYTVLCAPDSFVNPSIWDSLKDFRPDVFGKPPPIFHPASREGFLYGEIRKLEFRLHARVLALKSSNDIVVRNPQFESTNRPELNIFAEDFPLAFVAIADGYRFDSSDSIGASLEQLILSARDASDILLNVAIISRAIEREPNLLESLQPALTSFLHKRLSAGNSTEKEFRNLLGFFTELSRRSLFSYSKFLQYLIARGDLDDEEATNPLRKFITCLPFFNASRAGLAYRSSLLYSKNGKAEKLSSDARIEDAKQIVVGVLKGMFKNGELNLYRSTNRKEATEGSLLDLKRLELAVSTMSSFETQSVAEWLKGQITEFVVQSVVINVNDWKKHLSGSAPGSSMLTIDEFIASVRILEVLNVEHVILEICIWLITRSGEKGLLRYVIDALRRLYSRLVLTGEITAMFNGLWGHFNSLQKAKFSSIECALQQFLLSLYTQPLLECPAVAKVALSELQQNKVNKPPKDNAAEFPDIRDLRDTDESIAAAVSNLIYRYSFNPDSTKRIFLYSIEMLKKISLANQIDTVVEVLCQFNNSSGYLESVVQDYLLDLVANPSKFPEQISNPLSPTQSGWFLTFLFKLLLSKSLSVTIVVNSLLVPGVTKILNEGFKGSLLELTYYVLLLGQAILAHETVANRFPCFTIGLRDLFTIDAARSYDFNSPNVNKDIFIFLRSVCQLRVILKSALADSSPSKAPMLTLVNDFVGFVSSNERIRSTCRANCESLYELSLVPWLNMERELAIRNAQKASTQNAQLQASQKRKVLLAKPKEDLRQQQQDQCLASLDFLYNIIFVDEKSPFGSGFPQTLSNIGALFNRLADSIDSKPLALTIVQIKVLFKSIQLLDVLLPTLKDIPLSQFDSMLAQKAVEMAFREGGHRLHDLLPVGVNLHGLEIIRTRSELHLAQVLRFLDLPDGVKGWSSAEGVDEANAGLTSAAMGLIDALEKAEPQLFQPSMDGRLPEPIVKFVASTFSQMRWFLEKASQLEVVEFGGLKAPSNDAPLHPEVAKSLTIMHSFVSRLRCLARMVPLVMSHVEQFNLIELMDALLMLLSTTLVHGNGSQMDLFTFTYDLTGWIQDEILRTEKIKQSMLVLLRDIPSRMNYRSCVVEKILLLLPFQANNVYCEQLIHSSSTTGSTPALAHFKPLETIEQWQNVSPFCEPVPEGEGSAWWTPPAELNNTPISLSMFGARVVGPPTKPLLERLQDEGWEFGSVTNPEPFLANMREAMQRKRTDACDGDVEVVGVGGSEDEEGEEGVVEVPLDEVPDRAAGGNWEGAGGGERLRRARLDGNGEMDEREVKRLRNS
ncbi:hypothetical protein DFJ73DRAFT_830655 [Zopfochytrium polystomum]|nr:hypothetical protein DFJ73DRAFT_830655 [Zopfochytrium polystomum]